MADIDLCDLNLTLTLRTYHTRTESPAPSSTPPLSRPTFLSPPPLDGEKDARIRIKRSRTETNLGRMIEGNQRSACGAGGETLATMSAVRAEQEETMCRALSSTSGGGDQRSADIISDEEDGGGGAVDVCGDVVGERKKLRLSKEQSAVLEQSFRAHTTLNTKQKVALADQLCLRPRQVEVWFQNRRARTKLKQTEVECEYLKKCCEKLTQENRRLHNEVQELRALKLSPDRMNPPTTLTLC